MKDFWPDLLKVAAAHSQSIKAALERCERSHDEDRIHRIEVSLDEVIKYEEEENRHMLDLHHTLLGQIVDLKQRVATLQRDLDELRGSVAGWLYDRAG